MTHFYIYTRIFVLSSCINERKKNKRKLSEKS